MTLRAFLLLMQMIENHPGMMLEKPSSIPTPRWRAMLMQYTNNHTKVM
jgi:hypothetical protein